MGWFLLSDSGQLTEVFHSAAISNPLCSLLRDGVHRLPWCLAQLNAGRAVLIYDSADLCPAAEVDQVFLKAADVCSLALIPSNSASLGRTVLILSSNSTVIEWSEGIVEQCTLLEDIFSNAYQRGLAQDDSQLNVDCFQRFFATSISAMAIFNRRGRFISSNVAFRNILGYSEIELQTDEVRGFLRVLQADAMRSLVDMSKLLSAKIRPQFLLVSRPIRLKTSIRKIVWCW